MHARLFPSRESFRALASQGNLIPVYREVIADMETPVSAFQKIDTGDHSFLFESVEKGGKFARYSFLGASPNLIFQARGKRITLQEGATRREFVCEGDPLHELERLMAAYRPVAHEELPLFYGGAVGYLGYEAVTHFEPSVPRAKKDDLDVPDAYFFVTDTLLIFDHQERRIKIVANAHVTDPAQADRAYDEAVSKIEELEARLQRPARASLLPIMGEVPALEPTVNMTRDEYVKMTEAMQEFIRAGDIFQVVPSQRFEVPFDGPPIDLYRALRLVNPSPYMICLNGVGRGLAGAACALRAGARANPAHRRDASARADPGGGRPAVRRVAGRSERARRTRHAGRSRAQRCGARL
jgi:anthranilate synthase component 1